MREDLEKISSFIGEHHVMSVATSLSEELSVCSLFYAYSSSDKRFVFASDKATTHIYHIINNPKIAGNILLETKEISLIRGLQFQGACSELVDDELKKLYYKKFPYSLALKPTLWQIEVDSFKMTDNRLGFGKKIIWP